MTGFTFRTWVRTVYIRCVPYPLVDDPGGGESMANVPYGIFRERSVNCRHSNHSTGAIWLRLGLLVEGDSCAGTDQTASGQSHQRLLFGRIC